MNNKDKRGAEVIDDFENVIESYPDGDLPEVDDSASQTVIEALAFFEDLIADQFDKDKLDRFFSGLRHKAKTKTKDDPSSLPWRSLASAISDSRWAERY